MLTQHTTAERLNEIVNHSSIFPWVCGYRTEPFDLTAFSANPDNVCLVGEHGSVIFQKHQPGIYEFHTCVLPEGRGQWMLDGAKAAFRWMFTKTDAFELITKCPDGNIASKAGARAVGCSNVFRTRPTWSTEKGLVSVDIWSILLQHWIKQTPEMTAIGADFHDKLEQKYALLGKKDAHGADEVHNQYVGATIEMILNGQVNKAVCFYNRWAKLSGYQLISVNSYEPLVINIQESLLRVENGDFEIV